MSHEADRRIELVQRLDGEIGELVRRSRRVLRRQAARVHPDLNGPTYLMLVHLCQEGPTRGADLAERFTVDKGTVSRGVQTLLTAGLVERRVDPDDRRAVLISATDEARAKIEEATAARSSGVADSIGPWSLDEVEAFVAAFSRYNASHDAVWAQRLD